MYMYRPQYENGLGFPWLTVKRTDFIRTVSSFVHKVPRTITRGKDMTLESHEAAPNTEN